MSRESKVEPGTSTRESVRQPTWQSRALLAVVVCVFLVSLAIALRHIGEPPSALRNDAVTYDSLAISLIKHHAYTIRGKFHSYEPPAYPVFLAIVYSVFGHSLLPVFIVQALLLALSLLLAHRITLDITRDGATAFITCLLCALWKPFYTAVDVVLTENLAGVLIALSLWYVLKAIEQPTRARSVAAGLLVGLSALVKPVVLPFIPIAGILVALSGNERLRRLRSAALLLVCAAAAIGPWIARDYRVTGKLVPISTAGSFCLWLGNNPGYLDEPVHTSGPRKHLRAALIGKSTTERDRYLREQAVRFITENPARAVRAFLTKFSDLWLGGVGRNPRSYNERIPAVKGIAVPHLAIAAVPLLIAALLGWIVMPGDARKRARPITYLLLLWTVSHVLIYSERRYAIPVQFYEIMFAAVALKYVARAAVARLGASGAKQEAH